MSVRPLLLVTLLSLNLAAETRLETASRLLTSGRPAEARAVLEDVLRSNPANVEALELLGRVHLREREPKKARESAKRILELDPKRASAHCLVAMAASSEIGGANVFRKMSLSGEIRSSFAKALELDPRNRTAREGLFQFYRQAPSVAGGGLDKAGALAEESVQADPALGHAMKARLHAARKETGKALAEYLLSVASEPPYVPALNEVGYLELELKQPDAALGHFRRQVELAPANANAHDSLGDGLMVKGLLDEAIAAYREAARLDPGFAAAVFHLGQALERKGRIGEAVEQYRKAAGMSPSDPQVRQAKERLSTLGLS